MIRTEDGVELNYIESGDGAVPVVLLHAFPLSSAMWEPQLDALGSSYRLIAPDLRGFGGSSAPEDPAMYSMEIYARDVLTFLDELGIAQAVIVGLSMGGYIAFELWRQARSRVAALVLADTRAAPDNAEGRAKRSAQQDAVRNEGIGNLVEILIDGLLGPITKEQEPDVVDRVKALMQNPAAGYIGALEALKQRPDSTPDLPGIDVPTLILVGADDALTPPAMSEEMHAGIRDSRLVVIPRAGHLSNIESPAAFNDTLGGFLSSL